MKAKMTSLHTVPPIHYPLVMGILNVSPDSFSGDGANSKEVLLEKVLEMVESDVSCIDIGAQSTRPGAVQISEDEEMQKIRDAIHLVKSVAPSIPISIDTVRASVAEIGMEEGASIINDVSGGLFDERMFTVIAAHPAVCYVLGHIHGNFETMHEKREYKDVTEEVLTFWRERIARLESFGVTKDRIMCDPGIGFSKRKEENITLIREATRLVSGVDVPVLFGVSRKKFIRTITGREDKDSLDRYSLALCVTLFHQGVVAFRVHEVRHTVRTLKLLHELYA